jgi:HK97 family phage major capsid protein
MPTLKQCQDKVQGLIAQQKSILDDESAYPSWLERKSAFQAIETDVKVAMEQLAAVKGVADMEKLFEGGTEAQGVGVSAEKTVKSLGQQLTEHADFQAITSRKGSRFTSGAIAVKDLTVTDPVRPGVRPNTQLPGIVDIRFRPLTIRQVLLGGSMAGTSVSYLVETGATNAAAAVAQGGLKPESSLQLDSVIETAKKVATTLTTPDEILDDISYATSYIDGRLRTFVDLTTEDQILNGSGTGSNLRGLLNRTGLATPVQIGASNDDRIAAIFRQMTAIRTTSWIDPDAILINPADWQTIQLSKDADGRYIGGGPFSAAAGPSLWGLPVVSTPAIAQGKTLIGAFGSCAQVLQRTGLTVEATNTNEDDFVHNRVTFRAEERVALCVYRPGAFGLVTPAS